MRYGRAITKLTTEKKKEEIFALYLDINAFVKTLTYLLGIDLYRKATQ